MSEEVTRARFTLRFHDAETHRMLAVVADELGLSMTDVAEIFIVEGLDRARTGLAWRLERTLEDLSSWKGAPIDDRRRELRAEAQAFADAEVEIEDPLTSRAQTPEDDPLGIQRIFADALEH
jgi:hypothetical protein